MVGEFALGCQIIKDKNALLQIILYSVLTWALIVAMNYPFYYVFDLETKTLGSVGFYFIFSDHISVTSLMKAEETESALEHTEGPSGGASI